MRQRGRRGGPVMSQRNLISIVGAVIIVVVTFFLRIKQRL
jgi:hypothetical protein